MKDSRQSRRPGRPMPLSEKTQLRSMKLALNSLGEGVIIVDAAGHEFFSNEAGRRLSPLEQRTGTTNQSPSRQCQLSYPDGNQIPTEETPLTRALRGQHVDDFEMTVVKSDGSASYISSSASPIWDEHGSIIGAVAVFRDVTERKQAEKKVQQTLETLRRFTISTIEAVGRAVDMRDPYTSGHERRVAKLACTIARAMGLPADQIQGIELAASIHDIGKIYVPAEFLSKPGRLTDIEQTLIRTHPVIGGEIVRPIECPWPLADIILQHHERFDGSGYPAGLKGEEILLEARIVAVADTVEAMASYRPYRQALGVEKAIEEITLHQGIYYDPRVVDTCLDIFGTIGLWD